MVSLIFMEFGENVTKVKSSSKLVQKNFRRFARKGDFLDTVFMFREPSMGFLIQPFRCEIIGITK